MVNIDVSLSLSPSTLSCLVAVIPFTIMIVVAIVYCKSNWDYRMTDAFGKTLLACSVVQFFCFFIATLMSVTKLHVIITIIWFIITILCSYYCGEECVF